MFTVNQIETDSSGMKLIHAGNSHVLFDFKDTKNDGNPSFEHC